MTRCARMLSRGLKGFKRIVFHLAPDAKSTAVEYEIHGKTVVEEQESCTTVDLSENQ